MSKLGSLKTLASLLARPTAGDEEITLALAAVRDGLGASSAYIIYGVVDDFECFSDGDELELSRNAIWITNRELTTHRAPMTLAAPRGRVSDFRQIDAGSSADYVAAVLPIARTTANMLLVRGPWQAGLDKDQQDFLVAALPSLALLVTRRLNIDNAEREHANFSALVNVGRAISDTQDLESMLRSIAATAATIAGLEFVSIDIVDRDGSLRMRCVSYETPQTTQEQTRWQRGAQRPDPVRDMVLASKQPMMFRDAQNDERIPESARKFFARSLIRSAGVFPLLVRDEVMGTFSVAAMHPIEFSKRQLELIDSLTAQVAMAVKGVQLYEDRADAEEALTKSQELLRATLESTADGILVVDAGGKAAYYNLRFAQMWGIPPEVLAQEDDDALLGFVLDQLSDPEGFIAKVRDLYESSDVSFDTVTFKDGRIFERYSRPLVEGAGAGGRVWSFRDVTTEKRVESALRQSEERFRSLVQNASDLITVIQADTTVLYQSPASERVLGHASSWLIGTRLSELVHEDDLARVLAFLREAMGSGSGTATLQARLKHADGSWVHAEIVGSDQRRDAAVGGLVLNIRDVSERKKLEEQLRFQAFHDPLTGLANRARFSDRLEHSLTRSARDHKRAAVLFMDVDDFKSINDSMGHTTGDHVLIEITRRVRECLRASDTAARFGGDEFALLLEDIEDDEQAPLVADRIFAALQQPFEVDGKEIHVRASIGIAVAEPGDASEDVLRNADVAMYAAKGHGKGRYEIYEPGMHVAMLARLELLADLDRALERNEFVLHYQPMVTLDDERVVGVEALVRWAHPKHGIIPPAEFIPLAEESGVILGLGRWVMFEACQQVRAWQDLYHNDPAWTLSVNVSVKQMQHAGFVDEVAEILRATGIPPQTLIVEITESVMMQDARLMLERLREVKKLGVRLAIDDFGTGYSSLSYLRQFPFDILKIDKSFVAGGDDTQERDLTRAIIDLGRTFQLDIVAEGIERLDQLSRLQSLDCGLGQGYYFAKPLERDALDALLHAATRRADAA